MSDIIKKIREGFEQCIIASLPITWTPLENRFNLEKNSFKNQVRRWGVLVLGGSQASSSMTLALTITRTFQVTLTNQYISTLNKDSNPQIALDEIEDAMQAILLNATQKKLNRPDLVLQTNLSSIEEPDLTSIENLAIVRFNLDVWYRQSYSNSCA